MRNIKINDLMNLEKEGLIVIIKNNQTTIKLLEKSLNYQAKLKLILKYENQETKSENELLKKEYNKLQDKLISSELKKRKLSLDKSFRERLSFEKKKSEEYSERKHQEQEKSVIKKRIKQDKENRENEIMIIGSYRDNGKSWQEIGSILNLTNSVLRKRYACYKYRLKKLDMENK